MSIVIENSHTNEEVEIQTNNVDIFVSWAKNLWGAANNL